MRIKLDNGYIPIDYEAERITKRVYRHKTKGDTIKYKVSPKAHNKTFEAFIVTVKSNRINHTCTEPLVLRSGGGDRLIKPNEWSLL